MQRYEIRGSTTEFRVRASFTVAVPVTDRLAQVVRRKTQLSSQLDDAIRPNDPAFCQFLLDVFPPGVEADRACRTTDPMGKSTGVNSLLVKNPVAGNPGVDEAMAIEVGELVVDRMGLVVLAGISPSVSIYHDRTRNI